MPERTLLLIKPDAVRRGLIGRITTRLEDKGLKIIGMKMLRFDDALVARHYNEHVNKDFFPSLRQFIMSGPVLAMAVEGQDVVKLTRMMMGATRHTEAAPGTIRGDYAFSTTENLIHGSDSDERAKIELEIFFNPEELFD